MLRRLIDGALLTVLDYDCVSNRLQSPYALTFLINEDNIAECFRKKPSFHDPKDSPQAWRRVRRRGTQLRHSAPNYSSSG